MNLSKHVTVDEFCRSNVATRRGIKNVMTLQQLKNAELLCQKVFEPIRDHLGKPIKINSGFRSVTLNKAIGGSSSSQHCKGEAMDIDLHDKGILEWIRENLEFDQMIFEFGTSEKADWIHISYSATRNRNQVLRATKKGGKTVYTSF